MSTLAANPPAPFEAVRRLVRALPDALPGKTRLARGALRLFGHAQPTYLPDRFGNRLCCPSLREPIALGLFASGVYEPQTVSAILRALPKNGVFVDVGANIGAISLAVAAQRPDARIICVEASPEMAAVLRQNISDNGRRNITVVECLVGAAACDAVSFYLAPTQKFGMGSIGPQFGATPIALPQRTLDDILGEQGVETVDAIKLDIEGAELGALRGMSRRLSLGHPSIIFEFSDWAESRIPGQAPGDAQAFLLTLGYTLSYLPPDGRALDRPLAVGGAMLLATKAVSPGSAALEPNGAAG